MDEQEHINNSPVNLVKAQALMGSAFWALILAVTSVRITTELLPVLAIAFMGVIFVLPYWIISYYLRRNFQLAKVLNYSYILLIYSLALVIAFFFFAWIQDLLIIAIIPIALLTLFFLEIRKLEQLIKSSKEKKDEN